MEPKPTGGDAAASQRKIRFAPKVKPSRKPKPTVVKTEVKVDEDADSKAQDLLRQFNEGSKGRLKAERKVVPTQIAFGYGGVSTTSIKSYSSSSRVVNDAANHYPGSSGLLEKEYKEPWDYYSYYPVTLPLRKPYSGNPELLDGEEFGEAASENITYNENLTNTGQELNLMEEESSEANPLLFLQIPPSVPMRKPLASNAAAAEDKGVKSCSNLNELPEGFMGKLLVYRSGAIKMKLGDTIYDVSSGSQGVFAQDVVAINTADKHCCILGELNKRALLTPDVDSILDSISQL